VPIINRLKAAHRVVENPFRYLEIHTKFRQPRAESATQIVQTHIN
jgi:hypothetical protein